MKKSIKSRALAYFAGAFLCLGWAFLPVLGEFGKRITVFAEQGEENVTKNVCAPQGEGAQARKEELLLSRFTTSFNPAQTERSHNIRLAAKLLDGCFVPGGARFSFNERVGERTAERGFLAAPIIKDGAFVPGTGGGVCQVSTTLYNAALLAGMEICEAHPHSLRVGYVPPSLDAMVSSHSDMQFCNPQSTPVVVRTYTSEREITVEIYGRKGVYTYRTESVVIRETEPPMPVIEVGEEDEILRSEKKGTESESYLIYYRDGKRVGGRRIRRDAYACVQGIVRRKRTVEEGQSQDIFDENGEKIA